MYGQMTAGSWIYIGSQGIVQGTFETFGAAGEKHFGGNRSTANSSLAADSAEWVARNRLAATMNGALLPRHRSGSGTDRETARRAVIAIRWRLRSMKR